MTERTAEISRNTLETKISVRLNLDGSGKAELDTGIPFLDHMLDQVARHGLVDLRVQAEGDLHIDDHHTVEDIGITLGQAFAKAIGDKKGMVRYGHSLRAAGRSAVARGGRSLGPPGAGVPRAVHARQRRRLRRRPVPRVLPGLRQPRRRDAAHRQPARRNSHHQAETVFKAFGRALRMAVTPMRAWPASRPRPPRAACSAMTMQRVAVVDYGMGNLHSVAKALSMSARASEVLVTGDPGNHARRRPRGLPRRRRHARLHGGAEGVAAWTGAKCARRPQKPLLAICIGMQALIDRPARRTAASPASASCRARDHFGDLLRKRRRQHAEGAAHGLEPRAPESTIRCGRHPAGQPLLLRAQLLRGAGTARAGGRRLRIRPRLRRRARARQPVRGAVPPGKSHTAGLQLLANFVAWNGRALECAC
jgi:imidazoleglycerol-phosphate dehydratase